MKFGFLRVINMGKGTMHEFHVVCCVICGMWRMLGSRINFHPLNGGGWTYGVLFLM